MSHDEDPIWHAAVIPGVIVGPTNSLGDVAGHLLYGDGGQKAIVDGDEHEPFVDERLWLELDVGLVAGSRTTAVNPHDNRMILAARGSINIEHLPFIRGFGVRDAVLDFRLRSLEWGNEEQTKQSSLGS